MIVLVVSAGFAGGAVSGRISGAGEVRAQQPSSPDHEVIVVPTGGLVFTTPSGRVIARLDNTDAGGRFGVYGSDDEGVAVMAASPSGGVLSVYTADGKPVGTLAAYGTGGILGVYTNEGKPLWEAPMPVTPKPHASARHGAARVSP